VGMKTTEPRLLSVEAVADLPVLWATFQKMDLLVILDRHFPAPLHWKGPLSPAEVLAIWLLFITTQGDHCLNHLQTWVERHQRTLSAILGKPVIPTDAHDDRLADCLDRLAADDLFAAVERDFNQQSIRVYQLPTDLVRIDTTTANSYADVLSEQGLLQFGHSKDDPDRPQLKIAVAILDPLGIPLATAVVPGNSADDPLYIPAIRSVQQSLGVGGSTYVGDCKMAALATRAFVASGGDLYLCPLAQTQVSRAQRSELLSSVWDGTQVLQQMWRPGPVGKPDELVAEGFSIDVDLTATVDENLVRWTERRWLVRSVAHAQSQEAALERRLAVAEAALRELPKRKQGKKALSGEELGQAADAIVTHEGMEGLLSCTVRVVMTTVSKRAYGSRSARKETKVSFEMDVDRNHTGIKEKQREMGWQVYGTNGLGMVLPQVVRAYRGQYRIEHDWSRLKGRSLGLTPLYLQDENRIQGLVHLLSVALRVLSLVEWVVREGLRKEGSKLEGVYAGQPGRKTTRPSAELLLEVMSTISVSMVEMNGQIHALLSPLTQVQQRLLQLWGMPADLYEKLTRAFSQPPSNTSEP
jgi:transposase